jgi:hypothetical protein
MGVGKDSRMKNIASLISFVELIFPGSPTLTKQALPNEFFAHRSGRIGAAALECKSREGKCCRGSFANEMYF